MSADSGDRVGVEREALRKRRPGGSTVEHGQTGPARLIVVDGQDAGRKYVVDERATIGRSAEATIHLDDDEVSRLHAELRRNSEDRFVLVDLDSRNGTFVNDLPIREHVLAVGDTIRLGMRTRLVLTRVDPIEQAIQQRQRLEALGQLTAGIAHDFNNMVGALAATCDFMARLPPATALGAPEARECLEDLATATARAGALTRSLLDFAKGSGAAFEAVDVGAICAELASVLRRTLPRSIVVEHATEPRLLARANPTELYQVLMNLCVNARDAMPSGGRLTLDARRSVDAPPAAPDASIVIAVSDTGSGIDEQTKPRIFEPFFTTKERGAGFGIGLSTVRDIVRAHGGHVGVESELGRGTTFRVYLPPAQSIPRRVPRPERVLRRPSVRTGGRVLIVDDEAVVRRSVRRVLQQAGYSAVEAASGTAALELFSKQADQFDVVLLDVDMPGMDGPRTLSALRERMPELRGLFMTGHTAGPRFGTTPCLRKPCSAEEIVAAVGRAYETAPEDDEWTEVTSCR